MPDGKPVIDGQYIVVLEDGGVTLGEEHLAQTIRRDVSDTQEDRLAESGLNPVCLFYRVFMILLQGTNVSDITFTSLNLLASAICKERLRIVPTIFSLIGPIL